MAIGEGGRKSVGILVILKQNYENVTFTTKASDRNEQPAFGLFEGRA